MPRLTIFADYHFFLDFHAIHYSVQQRERRPNVQRMNAAYAWQMSVGNQENKCFQARAKRREDHYFEYSAHRAKSLYAIFLRSHKGTQQATLCTPVEFCKEGVPVLLKANNREEIPPARFACLRGLFTTPPQSTRPASPATITRPSRQYVVARWLHPSRHQTFAVIDFRHLYEDRRWQKTSTPPCCSIFVGVFAVRIMR